MKAGRFSLLVVVGVVLAAALYAGGTDVQLDLAQGLLRPTALVSGDFDEDGVADLVCGYAGGDGGLVTLHRGNGDSAEPFLSPVDEVELEVAPEFLGAGDFDNDGHLDLVVAGDDDARLHLLLGDGHGGFVASAPLTLPGVVTSLIAGEINRADGLEDLIVVVRRGETAELLVFQAADGALRAEPEIFPVPVSAGSPALGRFDDDAWIDLAFGAGHELTVVLGRDRRLSLGDDRADDAAPILERSSLPGNILSIASGDFRQAGDSRYEVAALLESGTVVFLQREGTHAGHAAWKLFDERPVSASAVRFDDAVGRKLLVTTRSAALPVDQLVVLDRGMGRLHVVANEPAMREYEGRRIDLASTLAAVDRGTVDLDGPPVAVLSMRLNADGLSDLVILQDGGVGPTFEMSAPLALITVNSPLDTVVAGDGLCTLREAIGNANANADTTAGDCAAGAGVDTIGFNIAGGGVIATITPASALPAILDPVTIDGSTQGCPGPPCIVLDGNLAGPGIDGLSLGAGSSTVRGLIIHRFGGRGIFINSGGNFVEGNFIGTDTTGTIDFGNALGGVVIQGAGNNTIGGTAAGAGNLISGNDTDGILIIAAGASGNRVLGNSIGTDVSGALDLGNFDAGVQIQDAPNNIVGGTTAQARNVIAGNGGDGVYIFSAPSLGNLVQGNYIGISVDGLADLGNADDGIQIQDAPNNTVGGTAAGAGNVISGNVDDGIVIISAAATGNLVQGNLIGTQANGTADLGNSSDGIVISNASNNTIGGAIAASRNVISGNDDDGVALISAAADNFVRGNFIGTDVGGTLDLGNADDGIVIQNASTNTIGGTGIGEGNVVSGNDSDGLLFSSGSTGNLVQGNRVGTDSGGSADLGNGDDGIEIRGASGNTIGGTAEGSSNVISGNDGDGIAISSGSAGNQIQGNQIGTDASGLLSLGNADNGIQIQDAPNNVIGGTTAESRNIISGNGAEGVYIFSIASTGNEILGNYIGTDATGTADLGNTLDGVLIQDAPGNIVGGSAAGAGNVISGNDDEGISIVSIDATGNQLQGNLIGTDSTGTLDLGNLADGVSIRAASGNTVGGTLSGARNVISGNGGDGIAMVLGASGNQVLGNYIGTDISGTAVLGNTSNGIQIHDAPSNTVGGVTAAERNVISGNQADGIYVLSAGAVGNEIQGNYIGTDSSGAVDLGNADDGIDIQDAADNIVGGTTPGQRNVISGNDGDGVVIEALGATGNELLGNYIGTNAAGATDLGNTGNGVRISGAPGNLVGGSAVGAGNVISGNDSEGIAIVAANASANSIQGNLIGTDAGGTLDLGNSSEGIVINGAPNNTIGGTSVGARNVVSGNDADGIAIVSGASGNLVLGNYIGTGVGGAAALGNSDDGVQIHGASGNTIGGVVAGSGNVISGNGDDGIELFSSTTTGNTIQGNLIGTNAAGTAPVGNGSDGIVIQGGLDNLVGGTTAEARNVIAGNVDDGVVLSAGASGNRILGNSIGAGGAPLLGNGDDGVLIDNATNNPIGGLTAGAANLIRDHGGKGVFVIGTSSSAILGNSILSNAGLGIALGTGNVLPNDPGDLDTGPNDLRNYPVLLAITSSPTGTNIEGTLNSLAGTTFRLEFFLNDACDLSGHGEGGAFIRSLDVTTDLGGNAQFATSFPTPIAIGDFVTSTATNLLSVTPPIQGNTSEFSACATVQPTIDLDKFLSGNADEDGSGNVSVGDTLTYGFTVTNTGIVTLSAITVVDPLPGLSAINCGGVTILAPAAWVTCTATYTVTLADVTAGFITNTATATGTEPSGPQVSDVDVESICIAPPGTLQLTLGKQGTETELIWTSQAGATTYDLVSGNLAALTAGGGDFSLATTECIADDVSGPSLLYAGLPPAAGDAVWFLVRAADCSGGTYDTGIASQVGLRDAEIAASGNDCP